jgi:hypothetical protein
LGLILNVNCYSGKNRRTWENNFEINAIKSNENPI